MKDFIFSVKFLVVANVTLMLLSSELHAQVLSLDSILFIVENSNPVFNIYDSRIKAYNEYATGAKSLDPPQAGAGFFMTPYNVSMWRDDEMTGDPGMGSFMISGQQMFPHPKKLDANYDYMSSMSGVDSSMKNVMRNELFMMVKMDYYEWIIMKKKLVILTESEALIEYLIASTELGYTYGMDKLNSYYKARAMQGDVQTMRLMLEQEIKQKMIQLNSFMNRDQFIVFDIDTIYRVHNYELSVTDTLMISETRSDYHLLATELGVLEARQRYENSKRLPDFGIRYDHMIPFGSVPQQFSLMFMVSIPIAPWSSKMYSSNVSGLDFEMQSIREEQYTLVNQVSNNLNNLKTQIYSKKQQIGLTEKVIIPSMEKNYEVEFLAYEQNSEMLFMVLDAWQNLKLSKLTYLDQLMELLTLQVLYEKEMEVIE